MQSTTYSTQCTLRFSRCQRVRFDKCWHEAMNKEQLDEMLNDEKYTSTMKKRNENDGEQSDDDDEEDKIRKASERKMREPSKRKNIKKKD